MAAGTDPDRNDLALSSGPLALDAQEPMAHIEYEVVPPALQHGARDDDAESRRRGSDLERREPAFYVDVSAIRVRTLVRIPDGNDLNRAG